MTNKQFEIEATDRLMQVKYEIEKRNISYVKSVDVFQSMGRGFFYVEVKLEVNILGIVHKDCVVGYLAKTNIHHISHEVFLDSMLEGIRTKYKKLMTEEVS